MKSLLCAFILLLGLVCASTIKIDDKEVCRYADSILLAYDAMRRLYTYKDKIDRARSGLVMLLEAWRGFKRPSKRPQMHCQESKVARLDSKSLKAKARGKACG